MRKTILIIICIICVLSANAQITRQNQDFEQVHLIDNRVAFIKEIDLQGITLEHAYNILREWGKQNYGKDPFISSIRYETKKNPEKKEILAKSRIELILPENSHRIREKMIMRYRVDGFIQDNKCILQITELSFLHENTKDTRLPRIIRAEDFITDDQLKVNDDLQELKTNTKKATIYFLNNLTRDFEKLFGY